MSKTITMPLNEASSEQMREFANDSLGLNLPPNTKPETILARIQSAWAKAEITIQDPEDQPEDVQMDIPAEDAPIIEGKEPLVTVIIDETEEAGGSEPVYLSVNNVPILVARGKEQEVKYRYYEVLKNAVKTIFDQKGEGVNAYLEPRNVPQYPFRETKSPTDDEVKAWVDACAEAQRQEVAEAQEKAAA